MYFNVLLKGVATDKFEQFFFVLAVFQEVRPIALYFFAFITIIHFLYESILLCTIPTM